MKKKKKEAFCESIFETTAAAVAVNRRVYYSNERDNFFKAAIVHRLRGKSDRPTNRASGVSIPLVFLCVCESSPLSSAASFLIFLFKNFFFF